MDYPRFQQFQQELQNSTNTLFSVTNSCSTREPHTLTLCCKFGGRATWRKGGQQQSQDGVKDVEGFLDKLKTKKHDCPSKMTVSISSIPGVPVRVQLTLRHDGHDPSGADELQELKTHPR